MITDVIKVLEDLIERKAVVEYGPRTSGDLQATWANIDRANRLLDWQPRISIEEGLSRTVRWYRDRASELREKPPSLVLRPASNIGLPPPPSLLFHRPFALQSWRYLSGPRPSHSIDICVHPVSNAVSRTIYGIVSIGYIDRGARSPTS